MASPAPTPRKKARASILNFLTSQTKKSEEPGYTSVVPAKAPTTQGPSNGAPSSAGAALPHYETTGERAARAMLGGRFSSDSSQQKAEAAQKKKKKQKPRLSLMGGSQDPLKPSDAWMANSMCVDETHTVPEPPDLEAAKATQIKGKGYAPAPGKEKDKNELKILARIKSGVWGVETKGVPRPMTGALRPDARKRPLPGAHPEYPYEALVFKGGGAKGAIYPGAIRALEACGVMPYIKKFAGASAGALVAALLAAGLTADELFIELATTDLKPMILDSSTSLHQVRDIYSRYGMNPGNGLYQHIGYLFYKYLGSADVTFRELYEMYGVELAVSTANVSRAAVEMLHVKTAPDYPIRKAVRASMSLPVALHPCRDKNIHSVISEGVYKVQSEMQATGSDALPHAGGMMAQGDFDPSTMPVEMYVDGGLLNNYPIDSFDGWWLSMEKDDAFFRKVIGEGGHKNYVERFGSYDPKAGVREVNPRTIGFRLSSAYEPDAMHSRLGNDALELKVRKTTAAQLPDTMLAQRYSPHRFDLTNQAEQHLKLDRDLRACMTYIKNLRDEASLEAKAREKNFEVAPAAAAALAEHLNDPPSELKDMLGLKASTNVGRDMVELLRHHHYHHHSQENGKAKGTGPPPLVKVPTRADLEDVLSHEGWASDNIKMLYDKSDLDDASKLSAIQCLVRGAQSRAIPSLLQACDELEELLEAKGEVVIKRLCGMAPKGIENVFSFVGRLIEAIQMVNDERVQTKENYSRTCQLNTEYIGTMDFKLDEADHYFLWRKGYLSTYMWLEKRSKKAKEKKQKVGKAIAKELKKQAGVVEPAAAASSGAAASSSAADEAKPKAVSVKAAGKAAAPAVPASADVELTKQLSKVLTSKTLRDDEKVDIIQRRLERVSVAK